MKDRRFAIAACLLALIGASGAASATPACNKALLSGGYGFTATGFNAAGPLALVGRAVFDGNGGFTAVRTISSNGTIIQNAAVGGVYTVDADCRGTLTFTVGVPAAQGYDMVLDTFGTHLRLIGTQAGTMITIDADKQFVGSVP
jgi:hypothetical protein